MHTGFQVMNIRGLLIEFPSENRKFDETIIILEVSKPYTRQRSQHRRLCEESLEGLHHSANGRSQMFDQNASNPGFRHSLLDSHSTTWCP